MRINNVIQDTLQGTDIVKFIKSPRLRQCGHTERLNNAKVPNKVAARKEGKKRRSPEVMEGDLKIMRSCSRPEGMGEEETYSFSAAFVYRNT
jgi:hypothetical protein